MTWSSPPTQYRNGAIPLPVLLARSFLDVVPRVVIDGPLSTEEGRRLQEFYRPRAA